MPMLSVPLLNGLAGLNARSQGDQDEIQHTGWSSQDLPMNRMRATTLPNMPPRLDSYTLYHSYTLYPRLIAQLGLCHYYLDFCGKNDRPGDDGTLRSV